LKKRIWGGYFKSETKALAAGQATLEKFLRLVRKQP